jgi:hypothetical protein
MQNLRPGCHACGNLIVLAAIMPITIAIMIALTGLLAKPSTDSPNQVAA